MERKYYIAYGSNLNLEKMARRCPDAIIEGIAEITDYELLFRGENNRAVATIEPRTGGSVPVGIWSISISDEAHLDIYEGFPHLYYKEMFKVKMNGKEIPAMAYLMTAGRKISRPSKEYFSTIVQGYKDFGLNIDVLEYALMKCCGITASTIIYNWSERQEEQFEPICPRCGCKAMKNPIFSNALSRRADIYICDDCGMEESIYDAIGKPDDMEHWFAIKNDKL